MLEDLQRQLGYAFTQPHLLQQALTHRSYSADHNERLEFLGDSVLNLAVSRLLFERLGRADEGELSRARAHLVKQEPLHQLALSLRLSQCLRLGEGEMRSGGLQRPSILADAFEALMGAVYLDGGFEAAQAVVVQLITPLLKDLDVGQLGKDAKTQLQEWLQARRLKLPTYEVRQILGQAHLQEFEVACLVEDKNWTEVARGASRRAAEQAAAQLMLKRTLHS